MAVKGQASQTVVDLTDGFSVSLSQDSVAWNGGESSLGTAQSVSVTVTAYQGSSIASSYSIGECVCSDPTNCTATVSGSTVTISVAAAATTSGTVTIPVSITANGSTVTINKTFSYNIALKGATGSTGSTGPVGVSMRNKGEWSSGTAYTAGTTGGSYIDVVTLDGSSYMCKSSHTSSASNKPPNSTYWTLLSEKGETGETGATGGTGPAGDDAILVVITGDTVLRNNSGSITLTASVYVGGAAATVNESTGVVTFGGSTIGTIKWYEGSSGTGTAGGKHSVSASSVTNSLVVYARLEA